MKVFAVAPLSKISIEKIALEILNDFNPRLIRYPKALKVDQLFDTFLYKKFRWKLDIQETLPLNVEGYCDPKSRSIVLSEKTYLAIMDGDGRSRFTGTHEFAHVPLHARQLRERMISVSARSDRLFRQDRSLLEPYRDPEWQADYLAGALLMPANHVKKIHSSKKDRVEVIQEIAKIFQVSKQAAEVRLDKLGLR